MLSQPSGLPRISKRTNTTMTDQDPKANPLVEAAELVADELNTDVIHYNGAIDRPTDMHLIDACINRSKRPNVIVMLVTQGGDADAAYRIARCFQVMYDRFYLYVNGYCKSAGTLVALGAHELIVSDHGELGPLDVQMSKKDALWEMQSGLTVMDTLSALQANAFGAFEKFFLDIQRRSQGTITLRTAARISTDMTTGLFSQLYGQVDPLHIGEAARALSIAGDYGRRLLNHAGNIRPDSLEMIMAEYPSHGFVIDREEAKRLFNQVSKPTPNQQSLSDIIGIRALWPDINQAGGGIPFQFLSSEVTLGQVNEPNEAREKMDHEPAAKPEGAGFGDIAEASGEDPSRSNGQGTVVPEPEDAAHSVEGS